MALPELNQGSKNKNKEREQSYFAGENHSAQTAEQQSNKHIAHIRTDKSVMDKKRNANLHGQ